jgi:toxin CptA
MHGAPSVSYPVGRSRIAARLLLFLWIGGACCALAAWARLGHLDWRAGLLVLFVVGTGVAAWKGAPRGASSDVLDFDGSRWSIRGTTGLQAARARVALDGQSWLLVRMIEPGSASRWVWLERRTMPTRWQNLRRAVYSRPIPASQALTDARSAPIGAQHPLS